MRPVARGVTGEAAVDVGGSDSLRRPFEGSDGAAEGLAESNHE